MINSIFSFQKSSPDDTLGKADAIVTAVGVAEDIVYAKSTALQVNWDTESN